MCQVISDIYMRKALYILQTRAKTNILNVNEQIMFLMNEYSNIIKYVST